MMKIPLAVWEKSLIERFPEIWKTFYPRQYENLGSWNSPKWPAVSLAQIAGRILYEKDVYDIAPKIVARQLAKYQMPTFFATKPLIQAMLNTDPIDMTWSDLHLPMPCGVFILPTGSLMTSTGEIPFVGWCDAIRFEGSEPRIIIFYSYKEDGESALTDTVFTKNFSLGGMSAEIIDHLTVESDYDPQSDYHNLGPGSTIDSARVIKLIANLILAMETTPRMVKPGERTYIKRRSGTTELWSPNIVGNGYVVKTEGQPSTPTGMHYRPHWRRGHFRKQVCGPKNTERKIIWIEPVWCAWIKK
jgi:hypothetical protein